MNNYWVYLMCDSDDIEGVSFVKIGIAVNPFERMKTLQTGNPQKLHIDRMYKYKTKEMAYQIEQRLHDIFSTDRLEGEWFLNRPCMSGKIDDMELFLGKNLAGIQDKKADDLLTFRRVEGRDE